MPDTYSADVKLWLKWKNLSYDLRQVGPTFGISKSNTHLPPVGSECEVEVIVDGRIHAKPVRLTGINLERHAEGEHLRITWENAVDA